MESALFGQSGTNPTNGQPASPAQQKKSKQQAKPLLKVPDLSEIFRLKTPIFKLKKNTQGSRESAQHNHYSQNAGATVVPKGTSPGMVPRTGVIPTDDSGKSTSKTLYGLKKGYFTRNANAPSPGISKNNRITVSVDAVPVKSATAPMVVDSIPVKREDLSSLATSTNKGTGSHIQVPMLSTEVGATEMITSGKSQSSKDSIERKDGSHRPHGTELLGVAPGITKMTDLEKSPIWKKPGHREVVEGFLILTYRIEDLPDTPFIQILLRDQVVEGIVIHLKEARELKDTKLSFEETIRNLRPIVIPDREGGFREIYPEKGLAFVLEKGKDPSVPSNRVTQIIAEPVRANYLVIRAEQMMKTDPERSFKDVQLAVHHDQTNGPANWMLAKFERDRGDLVNARQHAIQAVKSDSKVPQYYLTLISILKETGEIDSAFQFLQTALPYCKDYPLFKSEAALLQGDLYRLASPPDYSQAVQQHLSVLEVVKPYLRSDQQEVRILMKKQALRAHLALALDESRLNAENNAESDKAWQSLNSASAIADNMIKKEQTDETPLWEVCVCATEVALDMPNLKEINPYIQTLKRLSTKLVRAQGILSYSVPGIQWKSGKALMNGMEVYASLQKFGLAFQCGERAWEFLQPVLDQRSASDRIRIANQILQIGVVSLESLGNRDEAFRWFEKSLKIASDLNDQADREAGAKAGLLLVRISNFYWKNDQQEKAVTIAKQATEMLEKANKEGLVSNAELAAPYTNLAMMYKKMGKIELAKKYAVSAKELQ